MPKGTVIRSTGRWIDVLVDSTVIASRIPGRMRLIHGDETQPVAIGDQVTLEILHDDSGIIHEVHQRQNCLFRRAAGRKIGKRQTIVANVDQIWVVQSTCQPDLNVGLIDRLLVACDAQEISVGIIINKSDLASTDLMHTMDGLVDQYGQLGYPVLLTSIEKPDSIDRLRNVLANKVSLLMGPSGVGKSSLLNALESSLNIPVEKISKKTNKGCHTTAHARLYPLSNGGSVADTPGIREFGLLDIEPWELAHFFRDLKPHLQKCHYSACTHDHEPRCGVKDAIEKGEITPSRYNSYLNILYSLHLGDLDTGR
ncbi:MAG: ribosome small subunit-dependent GTPase A [Bacteroidetes bacterium]|nr:ribosome small subunit-dependent GTPase A [Bacteroidota bacterium]